MLDPSFLRAVNTSIVPDTDNAYDIGSSTNRWRSGYFAGTVSVGVLQVGGTTVIDSSRNLVNIGKIESSGNYISNGSLSFFQRIPGYDITAVTFNAWYDGSAWNHPDTSKRAYLFYINDKDQEFQFWFKDVPGGGAWSKVAGITKDGNMGLAGYINASQVMVGGTTVINSSRRIINVPSIGTTLYPVDEVSIKVARIYGVWGSGILIPHINNSLAFAPKKWTVTVSPDPSSGTIDDAFDGHPSSNVRWNSFPVTIEIDFGATIHYWQVIGVAFIYRRYAQYVKIEVYDTSSDSYVTLLEVTDNTDHCVVWSGARSYVGKIRITLDNPNPDYGEVAVCQIFGYTAAFPNSQYVYKKGDTMYGNLVINGYVDPTNLLIGGTEVITSGRVLQNVNIDRASTDLPPCKVLEDRSEYTAVAGATAGTYWEAATDTYVDTSVGYKQVRLFCQIKCDNGIAGRVRLKDDSGNVLYSASTTSKSYVNVDSGWIDFPASTTRVYVEVGADSDGTTADTGYVRNIRIYCR